MTITQNSIDDAIAQESPSFTFEASAGEENGPYDPGAYLLHQGGQSYRGQSLRIDGKQITIGFPVAIMGDAMIELPTRGE